VARWPRGAAGEPATSYSLVAGAGGDGG
jgi:hypothetical protein